METFRSPSRQIVQRLVKGEREREACPMHGRQTWLESANERPGRAGRANGAHLRQKAARLVLWRSSFHIFWSKSPQNKTTPYLYFLRMKKQKLKKDEAFPTNDSLGSTRSNDSPKKNGEGEYLAYRNIFHAARLTFYARRSALERPPRCQRRSTSPLSVIGGREPIFTWWGVARRRRKGFGEVRAGAPWSVRANSTGPRRTPAA